MTKGFPPVSVSRRALLDADGRDRSFRRTVHDLMTVGMRMQEVGNRLAAALGVTGPQYSILMAIAHLQDEADGAGVRTVARRLHVSGPFITAQVNRLVADGLVDKSPDPDDGRAVRLQLSARGRRALEDLAPTIRAANDLFFAPLDAVDFAALSDIAARLEASSERALEELDTGAEDAVAAKKAG